MRGCSLFCGILSFVAIARVFVAWKVNEQSHWPYFLIWQAGKRKYCELCSRSSQEFRGRGINPSLKYSMDRATVCAVEKTWVGEWSRISPERSREEEVTGWLAEQSSVARVHRGRPARRGSCPSLCWKRACACCLQRCQRGGHQVCEDWEGGVGYVPGNSVICLFCHLFWDSSGLFL